MLQAQEQAACSTEIIGLQKFPTFWSAFPVLPFPGLQPTFSNFYNDRFVDRFVGLQVYLKGFLLVVHVVVNTSNSLLKQCRRRPLDTRAQHLVYTEPNGNFVTLHLIADVQTEAERSHRLFKRLFVRVLPHYTNTLSSFNLLNNIAPAQAASQMATNTTLFPKLPLFKNQIALLRPWLTASANAAIYAGWQTLPRNQLKLLV